jgi:hypothetical protein
MMRARNVKATVLALAAWFMCAAPAVQAAMYSWTDENGTATYSNQPPMQPAKVRDLAVMETISPAPGRAPAKFRERFTREAPRATESSASTGQDTDDSLRGLARIHARGRTEAVRDPCLISADPRCYERHKDRYHPYFGYAPSMTQPASSVGTGATDATGAAGAVAGNVQREPAPGARRLDPAPPLASGLR